MINETLTASIETLYTTVKSITHFASVLVGGVFGLYVVLIILRWKEAKDVNRRLISIERELKTMNQHLLKAMPSKKVPVQVKRK